MKTEYAPPYRALKSCGHWYVVNALDGYEVACECRHEAEIMADDLNSHAMPTSERLAAMLSQLARGPVHVAPFYPPDDEVSIFPD